MKRKFGIAALALIVVAGLGLFAIGPKNSTTTALVPFAPGAAIAQVAGAEAEAIEIVDFALGPEDAKVTVVEYASFTCPHCATFHASVFKPLKADYIDTDKIRFIYREVYFDRYGLWAAMMARCGGATRYFGISEILYSTQADWAQLQDPAVVVENLKRIGRTAGMDDASLDACMQDGAKAQAMVEHFQKNAEADKVEGTPTILVNGTKHSNMSYAELKTIIDAELAK